MSDFTRFVDEYYRRFGRVLETFDKGPLEEILEVLLRVSERGRRSGWLAMAAAPQLPTTQSATRPSGRTSKDGRPSGPSP